MQRAFQAGSHKSQQLDTDRFEIRSVARSKVAIMIPGLYSISWDVPVCHSAGHINFVVQLLVALHPGKP